MKYTFKQALGWLALYAVIVLSPLVVSMLGPRPAARGFWVELGAGLGFVGLGVLCLQFVITGRFREFAMGFGSDNLLQFHYASGIVGMFLVLLHPGVLLLADAQYLAFFDPRVNFMRSFALIGATVGVILVVVTSLWRTTFRLIYEWWRLSHGALAFLIVVAGMVHIVQVGHFTQPWWKQGYIIVLSNAALLSLLYVRLYKPLRLKSFPYQVTEVVKERGDAYSLIIEPIDHEGMPFEAGQYAWITLGETPFSLQQHPFSFASSKNHPRRLCFTAKKLGDFTSTWPDVEAGTRAYLEGPYGAFTIDEDAEAGAVFLAGGVGITPIMSLLRTLAEDEDPRHFVLFYANKNWDGVIFREEIEGFKEKLDLDVVHVLEEPPQDWNGESGFVEEDVLERHLPDREARYFYYICGPEPMMDLVESTLVNRKIPLPHIMSERFEIV
ncbi:MAG: ferric reductase-like transmembrane domain-containing protein [Bradymonadaceae bacterium]